MLQKRFTWFSALLAILILTALGAPGSLANTPTTGPTEAVVVRLYYTDQAQLDAVAGQLDVWEVNREEQYAVALVQPAEYGWLQSLDYRLEIDAGKTALLGIQAPLDPRFYYFDDFYPNSNDLYIVDFLQDVNTAYPDLTELEDIGDGWQASHGGHPRDIWVLRITNEDPTYGPIEDKPVFYLFATIHAREVAVPELAIRYIKYLTEGYNGEGGYDMDPDVTWMVNHNVIYVHVMQNPDGHVVNEQNTSAYRRKNMNNDECPTGDFGIDLNRNHTFFWGCCGGSSGNPCSETYRGTSAGSEPETQAFQDYFATVMKDQNGDNDDWTIAPASPLTTTGIFLSMHSYSDEVLWPWDLPQPPPNEPQLTVIGRKLGYYSTYEPTGSIGYLVDGPTDDWTYGRFGIASFTFEVGPGYGACGGFFPDYECLEGEAGRPENFWAENKPAFIFAHKIARTPYMTAYGPDAQNLAVSPDEVPQGTPVQLTATVADHRYGGDPLQPIYGAEYFLDAPGEDGTGTAMDPSDGSWGDLSEDVEVMVDTSTLMPGKHYLLVHGLNDDGDWGPFTAVFVTTTLGLEPEMIELAVSPDSIPIVHGQATVTATLTLSDGTPTPGWPVTFTTDLGTVDPSTVWAGEGGVATTTLYAADVTGTAEVSAEVVDLVADPVYVEFYMPDAPVAGFTSNSPVCTGTAVDFTNTSTSPPLAPADYLWDFGDGMTSTLESPSYVYPGAGTFDVSLTASNAGGSDSVIHSVYITPTPESAFTYEPLFPQPGDLVHFYDASSDNPTLWDWDFGDGASAGIQNPMHSFATTGTYTVTLTASNACGQGTTYQKAINIGAEPQYFIYLPIIVRTGP